MVLPKASKPCQVARGSNAPRALLICDSGWDEELTCGQGHLRRCQALAWQLHRLGWQCWLLELRLRCSAAQAAEPLWNNQNGDTGAASYKQLCWQVSREQLQSLTSLQEYSQKCSKAKEESIFWNRWQLVLIDSYQLPLEFYQDCLQTLKAKVGDPKFVAVDDFDRLHYPAEYYRLQACLPPLGWGSALRGLAYQVLRPEFTAGPEPKKAKSPGVLPALLVPGSAFSAAQLAVVVAVLRRQLPDHTPLHLLLSQGMPQPEIENRVRYFRQLSAGQLRSLYCQAQTIFCAAGQSLLEVLALRGGELLRREARQGSFGLCALLSADNQLGLLQQAQNPPNLSGYTLFSAIDLRGGLQGSLQDLAGLLQQALDICLPRMEQEHRMPPLSAAGGGAVRLQWADGRATERILRQIGLWGLATRPPQDRL